MPTRHREALRALCAGEVTLTRHPDGCVLVYPRAVWEEKRKALSALPFSARVLQRIVLGSALDESLDSAGRLLVPADLRALCHLDKEVTLIGLGAHFELWDAAQLAEEERKALEAGLTEKVDFNF